MADVVQYKLERMVPELDDLDRRGIFSRQEIAEIVKTRRKFEYRLKRPSPLKEDYLAYIDYEKQLDKLRILRRKLVAKELKAKGNKRMRKTVSDYGGVRRIIEIYRMATSRFKGDIGLWFQYLEFCREKENGRMKKALAQAIRFHPKVPGLWIYAAAWEFDHNLNVAAARALMQSGLRACPNSEDLWVEYLRMELTYLNKLKTRKVILGEDTGTLVRGDTTINEKQWREENKELFMSLDEERERELGLDAESRDCKDLLKEHGFSILRTVYASAISALPSCLSLRQRFFEIVEAIDLGHNEEMRNEILADMEKDFSGQPEYWDWLARLEITNSTNPLDLSKESLRSRVDKALKIYKTALQKLPLTRMFHLCVKFLMFVICPASETTQDSVVIDITTHTTGYTSHLLNVFETAETMKCLDKDLAYQYISFILHIGRLDEARKLAEKFTDGEFSDAIDVWIQRVSIEMKCVTRKLEKASDMASMFEIFRKPLMNFAVSEAEGLWLMALKFFSNNKKHFKKLLDLSVASLTRCGGSDDGFSLSSAILNFVVQKDGIQQARDLYKRYIELPRPGLTLYKYCIKLESNLASVGGDKDRLVKARKLFESALAAYRNDVSLWQDYYALETKFGTPETANALYWRAKKELKDAATLLAPLSR